MQIYSIYVSKINNHKHFFCIVHNRYFAPEYFMHGIIDEKTDVFSFGVLLLEIITGREALDESRKSLVLWVYVCAVNASCQYNSASNKSLVGLCRQSLCLTLMKLKNWWIHLWGITTMQRR